MKISYTSNHKLNRDNAMQGKMNGLFYSCNVTWINKCKKMFMQRDSRAPAFPRVTIYSDVTVTAAIMGWKIC